MLFPLVKFVPNCRLGTHVCPLGENAKTEAIENDIVFLAACRCDCTRISWPFVSDFSMSSHDWLAPDLSIHNKNAYLNAMHSEKVHINVQWIYYKLCKREPNEIMKVRMTINNTTICTLYFFGTISSTHHCEDYENVLHSMWTSFTERRQKCNEMRGVWRVASDWITFNRWQPILHCSIHCSVQRLINQWNSLGFANWNVW